MTFKYNTKERKKILKKSKKGKFEIPNRLEYLLPSIQSHQEKKRKVCQKKMVSVSRGATDISPKKAYHTTAKMLCCLLPELTYFASTFRVLRTLFIRKNNPRATPHTEWQEDLY